MYLLFLSYPEYPEGRNCISFIHLCFSQRWCSQRSQSEIFFFLTGIPIWLPINVYCNSSFPTMFLVYQPFTLNLQCPELRDNSMNKTFRHGGHVLHLRCPRWQPLATMSTCHVVSATEELKFYISFRFK